MSASPRKLEWIDSNNIVFNIDERGSAKLKSLNLKTLKTYDEIKDLNNKLLNNAEQFKLLFPDRSLGGKAADLIWTDRETFNLYNDNFIQDIENIMQSIEEEDSVSLSENFNKMAANCGTCHKKFRN